MEQLRSLFNGTKWKGNTLKYADYCSHVTNRIECAKPSYLELIKEEKEKVNVEVADSTKKEESVARLDPPSGIPNTLLIRKSKRKFFVASINPVYKDEDGNVIAMETESSTNEAHDSSLPENVSIPSTSSDSHVVSTKKCAFPISLTPRHRFIQPEVLCFDMSPVEGTRSSLWDPIPSPKRRRVQTAVPTEEFVKSSIRLDDSSDDSQHEEFLRELEEGNQGNQGNRERKEELFHLKVRTKMMEKKRKSKEVMCHLTVTKTKTKTKTKTTRRRTKRKESKKELFHLRVKMKRVKTKRVKMKVKVKVKANRVITQMKVKTIMKAKRKSNRIITKSSITKLIQKPIHLHPNRK